MSCAFDRLARQGERTIQRTGQRRSITVLTGQSAGVSFIGTITTDPSYIDPDMPLGKDPREAAFLEVLNEDAPEMESNDLISEGTTRWKLVSRENNPVDVTVRFRLAKLVEGKDR